MNQRLLRSKKNYLMRVKRRRLKRTRTRIKSIHNLLQKKLIQIKREKWIDLYFGIKI